MITKENKKYILVMFNIIAIINFLIPPVLKAEVMFIVNKSVKEDTLSKSQIQKIYLGHTLVWPDGELIKLVTQEGTDIQKEFTRTYIRKSEAQFSRYWRKLLFTGKGILPNPFFTEKEIIKYVANTKGAIGYISPQAATKDIKIINVSDN